MSQRSRNIGKSRGGKRPYPITRTELKLIRRMRQASKKKRSFKVDLEVDSSSGRIRMYIPEVSTGFEELT